MSAHATLTKTVETTTHHAALEFDLDVKSIGAATSTDLTTATDNPTTRVFATLGLDDAVGNTAAAEASVDDVTLRVADET